MRKEDVSALTMYHFAMVLLVAENKDLSNQIEDLIKRVDAETDFLEGQVGALKDENASLKAENEKLRGLLCVDCWHG